MPDEPVKQRERKPPAARTPERQQPSGWRVQPAPDGRGAQPDRPRSPWEGFGRRWLAIVLVLFALNLWISSLIPSGPERIRVSYSPTVGQ